MLLEFALDPGELRNWERIRFFVDSFGPCKGRFLARFPEDWPQRVLGALRDAGCGDIELARATEHLVSLKQACFRRRPSASYDDLKSWLENAKSEHSRDPFTAIVGADRDESLVLCANEVSDRCPVWTVTQGKMVPRDGRAYVDEIGLQLKVSRRILVVDPHFRAVPGPKLEPIKHLISTVGPSVTIEIHCAEGDDAFPKISYRVDEVRKNVPRLLGGQQSLTVHFWKERQRGKRLHNRSILTDVGGVQLGDSLQRGGDGELDHLSNLDFASWSALLEDFAGPEFAFDKAADPVSVSRAVPAESRARKR